MDNHKDYDRTEQQQEEESNWDLFGKLINEINKWNDYVLEISPNTTRGFQWFSVEKTPKINGLTYDGITTKFLTPLYKEDNGELSSNAHARLSEELFKYALPIIAYGFWDDRKPIAKAIKSYLVDSSLADNDDEVVTQHTVSIRNCKAPVVKSFIPELDQFPKSLTDLKLTRQDFLGWVYDSAEMDIMSLHCGRAGFFPQGAIPAGETRSVDHSYRNLVIIQSEPNYGKSQFLKWLNSGIKSLGLRSELIQDLGKQFGHGPWVTSNLSFMDDTTEKSLHYAFNSELLKSVCSNGTVNVESKGVNHISAKAITTPFVLANNIDARHLANCDSGNADRIKIIACKNSLTAMLAAKKLEPSSPLYGVTTLKPMDVIDYLCEKAKVDKKVLAAYFLRLCVDYFVSFTRDEQKDFVYSVSNDLYYNYSTNSMNVLLKAGVLSYILKTKGLGRSELEQMQINCTGAGNSIPLILASLETLADLASQIREDSCGKVKGLIRAHWELTGRGVSHPWMAFRNYSLSEICALGIRAVEAKKLLNNRTGLNATSLDNIYAMVFKDLKDIKGNPSVFSVSRIEAAFNEAMIAEIETVIGITKFIYEEDTIALNNFREEKPNFVALLSKLSDVNSGVQQVVSNDWFYHYKSQPKKVEQLW